jgi:16S rRNA C1402 N4-methylase RsmH
LNVDGSATEHIPVLAKILVEQIKLPHDAAMVDATIGQGGHSLLFGKGLGPKGAICFRRSAVQGDSGKLQFFRNS